MVVSEVDQSFSGVPPLPLFLELRDIGMVHQSQTGWDIVACPVIQAIGRPGFEDVLRTRSPGEGVSG